MTRVALVSARGMTDLDEDLAPLLEACGAGGLGASVEIWDDRSVDWASYDGVVVRSTWDYVPRRAEFLDWAEAVAARTRLANPPDVLAWSTDKRYLVDLGRAGVETVDTHLLEPGDTVTFPSDGEVVVKPAISAGSLDTARWGPQQRSEARAHAEDLLGAGRSVLVQPYLDAVDDRGEAALVFVGGRFSHACTKGPLLAPGGSMAEGPYAEETMSARPADPAEVDLAGRALAAVPGGPERLLYARVDLLEGPDGRLRVLELELAEPSLFTWLAPGSAEAFARAVATWLEGPADPRARVT